MTREGATGIPAPEETILARIRAATRPEHEAVERLMPLMRPDLSPGAYRDCLARFYGFFGPMERRIGAVDLAPFGITTDDRWRTPLLIRDLEGLGLDPGGLPTCADLPGVDGPAEAFGCLYVLEGSTLGGQAVGRHLNKLLGVTSEHGGAFFLARGERTGPMWRSFCGALSAFADGGPVRDRERVVDAAAATFRALRAWFGEGGVR